MFPKIGYKFQALYVKIGVFVAVVVTVLPWLPFW